MANYEHEQEIAANRRRRFMVVACPGCGDDVTPTNAGGYRCFCEKCVKAFPSFPTDGGGYVIQGRYPTFNWKRVSD